MRGNKYLSDGLVTLNGYSERNSISRWDVYKFKDSNEFPSIRKQTRFQYYDIKELDLFFKTSKDMRSSTVNSNQIMNEFVTTLRNIRHVW